MLDETPSPEVIVKHLDQRLKAAKKHVRSISKGRNVDIHQMRVDLRRASSCLQFFSPFLHPKQTKTLRRTLRDLRRGVGSLRDNEVLIHRSLHWTTIVPAEELGDFIIEVASSPSDDSSDSSQHISRAKAKIAAEEISTPSRLIAKDAKNSNVSWRELIRLQLTEDLAALHQPIQTDRVDKEALHQFRICCKHARYQLEIIDEADVADVKLLIKGFKTAQEDLGHIHDTFVILERLQHLKKDRCKLSKKSMKAIIASETASLQSDAMTFSAWWQSEQILDRLNDWLAS
jgi:CHAD domain-containing protein